MISQKNHIENPTQSENVKLQVELFSFHLDIEKEKNLDDKMKCNEIFKKLKNDLNYYIFNCWYCFEGYDL